LILTIGYTYIIGKIKNNIFILYKRNKLWHI